MSKTCVLGLLWPSYSAHICHQYWSIFRPDSLYYSVYDEWFWMESNSSVHKRRFQSPSLGRYSRQLQRYRYQLSLPTFALIVSISDSLDDIINLFKIEIWPLGVWEVLSISTISECSGKWGNDGIWVWGKLWIWRYLKKLDLENENIIEKYVKVGKTSCMKKSSHVIRPL